MMWTTGRAISYTVSGSYQCLEDLQKESIDLYLTYCGSECCQPSHRYGPNQRESYLIHIVQNGKGILELDERLYYLKQGDAFLIPAGVTAWYEADEKEPWTYSWIGFSGFMAEKCMDSAGFSRMNPVRRIGCTGEIGKLIIQVLDAHQPSVCDDVRRNGLLLLALSELIADYSQHDDAKRIEEKRSRSAAVYVKQAVEYLTYHYGERLRIGDLADKIGVNRSYLTSSFKKVMGVPPQEYLRNLRLEKARMLLQRTNLSISDVANQVGYSDQLAFSKVFKRYCGMSPRQYKEGKNELLLWKNKGEHFGERV